MREVELQKALHSNKETAGFPRGHMGPVGGLARGRRAVHSAWLVSDALCLVWFGLLV